ncbi:MAG: type II toxin-antitoxin system PemK/MazF family toxin, partial [Chloroflexia bacterium]|nr:type II toxin-antitoxin system PemK/MazF family toxin [Chloroflexia bacterium]
RTDKNLRIHVRVVPPEGGLRELSVILCDQPRSISHDGLDHRQGRVSAQAMAAVEDRLRRRLDL